MSLRLFTELRWAPSGHFHNIFCSFPYRRSRTDGSGKQLEKKRVELRGEKGVKKRINSFSGSDKRSLWRIWTRKRKQIFDDMHGVAGICLSHKRCASRATKPISPLFLCYWSRVCESCDNNAERFTRELRRVCAHILRFICL